MSTVIHHEIEIDAPPAAVWAVLADVDEYSDWNPFIRRLDGELRVGERLEVEIAPPGGRAMTLKPTVLVAKPGRELTWLGRLLVRGIVDGEHSFRIEDLPGGRSRLVQSERFSGILVGFVGKTLRKTEAGFAEMNAALKARAEARASSAGS
jgi:hypothetical protein